MGLDKPLDNGLPSLSEVGINNHKPAVTPLPMNLKLQVDEGQLFDDPSLYRCLVGKLNFLTNRGPDLAFIVLTLKSISVLRYVNSTLGQGIMPRTNDHLTLQAYSDTNRGAW